MNVREREREKDREIGRGKVVTKNTEAEEAQRRESE